jgi:PAS domain S-box-containing protein
MAELKKMRQKITQFEALHSNFKDEKERLMHQEKHLESLIRHSSLSMVTLDEKHNIVSCSRAFEELFQFQESEIIGSNLDEVIAPQGYLEHAKSHTKQTLRGHAIHGYGKRQRKDGDFIDVEFFGVPLILEGKLLGAYGIYQHISEGVRAQEALRESEERYKTILESIEDGYYEVDLAGNFTFMNDSMSKIFGYSKDELVKIDYKRLMDQETAQDTYKIFNGVYKTGRPVRGFQHEIIRKDGSKRYLEVSVSAIRGSNGHPTGFRGIMRDVTERKRSEEALKREQEKFRVVVEESPFGVLLVGKDGKYQYLNPKFVEMFGYTLEDIPTGREWFRKAYPDQKYRRQVISTWLDDRKEYKVGEARPRTFTVTGKDGSEKVIQFRPVTMAIGEQLMTCEDITERKRADEALWESEKRYRALVEESFDGIFIQKDTEIIFANQRLHEMLGYNEGKLLGLKHWLVYHPDYRKLAAARAQARMQGELVPSQYEIKLQCKDRSWFYGEVSARAVTVDGGPGVQVWVRDISDRKKAEETLHNAHEELEKRVEQRTADLARANDELLSEIARRKRVEVELKKSKEAADAANQAKSDFLANMSHELRTPLNHIIGFTELVADKNCGDLNETQEEYLNDVLQSGKHLLLLINDILDLSKVEAGKHELEVTDVNPGALLKNCLTMVKEKAIKHRIKLATNGVDIPDSIRADERKLKQIMYNLLSNAVKFTPDGGEVYTTAQLVDCMVRPGLRKGDPEELKIIEGAIDGAEIANTKQKKCIEFLVSDTGIGIRPEDHDRIFNPFEQVESSASRRYQGTGLGLSLTKMLVEMHGGKIWVESEGEGKGSAFRFIIPA